MSVLAGLAREHAIFKKLLERLEASAARDEATARRDVRKTLLILVSALDKHEKVENLVFGDPSYASREGAKLIVDQVGRQHQELSDLRLEFLEATSASEAAPLALLKRLVSLMAEGMRAHFRTEEEVLWPHYEDFSRSLDAAIRFKIERSVQDLERAVDANSAEISDYLETKK